MLTGYQQALSMISDKSFLNIGGTPLPIGYKDYVSAVNIESDTIPYNTLRFDIELALDEQGNKYWKFIKETEYTWQSNGDYKYLRSKKLGLTH